MELSQAGAAFIAGHEGFVPRWYLDPVGIPTIGIGFTWRSAAFRKWWSENRPGQPFKAGATMSRAEAEAALIRIVAAEYAPPVNLLIAGRDVPQHAFDAAVSVVFNCGAGALDWRWAGALAAGDFKGAARLLRDTAVTAKGKRLPGLVRRRAEEAALLAHGDYAGAAARLPKAVTAPAAALSKGARGGRVIALQQKLRDLGHLEGAVDGRFGAATEAALMDFQRAANLAVDGVAGEKTLVALETATRASKPAGTTAPPAAPKPAGPEADFTPPEPPPAGGLLPAALAALAAALVALWGWIIDIPCRVAGIICGG